MTDVDSTRLLPEQWPLHRIAKELGKATHVLVAASRHGKFPHVVMVGNVWYVNAAECVAWFERQHAPSSVTQAQRDRIRQAGRGEVVPPPRRPQIQPRASSASLS